MDKPIARIAVSAATYWIDKPYDYLIPDELLPSVKVGCRVIVPFSRSNRACEGIVLALAAQGSDKKLKSIESVLDLKPVLSPELIKLAIWMREHFFCTVYEAVKAMLPAGLWYSISSGCSLCEGYDRESAYACVTRSEKQKKVLDVLFSHGGECDMRELELAFGDDDPSAALRALRDKGVIRTESVSRRGVKDKTVSFAVLCVSAEEARETAASKKRSAPSQSAVLELLADFGELSVSDLRYFTGAANTTIKKLAEAGLIALEQTEVFRRPDYKHGEHLDMPGLSEDQQAAFEGLLKLANAAKPAAALLYGVTGSGKTLVYIRLIGELLKQGRGSIMLVPEIALTPQMLRSFSSYFGEDIAVLHSSLSVGERYDEWKRIKSGKARVVVGTRSAVFAPLENLGMIIIDEEQEDTYKSENSPRYNACDVAKYRCAKSGAILVLGSATPNIVTRYNAEIGKYSLFKLTERYNRQALPAVEIVDMKRELRAGNGGNLSSVLISELEANIAEGRQSILFLNRRGANKLITCVECGFTYKCPRCSVSLTYHSANNRLMCHYCGYSQPVGERCVECGGSLSFVGAGTQRIEEELETLFPNVPVIRMDTDTVSGAGSHELILDRFRDEKIPIMVGTQMVAKGLNFPNVTLVGVLSADQSLYCGDYRSAERTFSLITQVVGRSGRGQTPGRAVIQTFTPSNEVINQAARQDYDSFYQTELELRRIQGCPPFADIYAITAVGMDETQVLRCLNTARRLLLSSLGKKGVRILGPAPLAVVRINNLYRYRLTIYCKDSREIREELSRLLEYCNTNKEFKGVSVFGELDPVY
ncbi:MAG: primosomal protein N' [Oscillospiraceae bacterium]